MKYSAGRWKPFCLVSLCGWFVLISAQAFAGERSQSRVSSSQAQLKMSLESQFDVENLEPVLRYGSEAAFLRPNELNPDLAKPALQESAAGALVSVGTERGFLTSEIANNVTYLILLDRTYAVTIYNRINAALLKLSITGDRNDYLRLRQARSHDQWLKSLNESAEIFLESERKLLENPQAFQFWQEASQKTSLSKVMGGEHRLTPKSSYKKFENTNYLKFDGPFLRLQKLAKENRIIAVNFSLDNGDKVATLVKALKQSQIGLNVLDISNAWSGYIEQGRLKEALKEFSKISRPSTLLLTTKSDYAGFPAVVIEWEYASMGLIEAAQQPEGLLNYINKQFPTSCRARLQ